MSAAAGFQVFRSVCGLSVLGSCGLRGGGGVCEAGIARLDGSLDDRPSSRNKRLCMSETAGFSHVWAVGEVSILGALGDLVTHWIRDTGSV